MQSTLTKFIHQFYVGLISHSRTSIENKCVSITCDMRLLSQVMVASFVHFKAHEALAFLLTNIDSSMYSILRNNANQMNQMNMHTDIVLHRLAKS